jgi:flagellar assembly protein FliH
MSRWSADPVTGIFAGQTAGVMRGAATSGVTNARFDVPLGERPRLPAGVAERLRAEAQATGYAAGWAEGRRAAADAARTEREQLAVEVTALLAAQDATAVQALMAVTAAVRELEQRTAPAVAAMEADLVAAAFALAETIIGRELASATEPGRDALARALEFAPPGGTMIVRLNPADAAVLPDTTTVDGRDLVVVADPALASGDAVVQCAATTIESRIGAALARAQAAIQ